MWATEYLQMKTAQTKTAAGEAKLRRLTNKDSLSEAQSDAARQLLRRTYVRSQLKDPAKRDQFKQTDIQTSNSTSPAFGEKMQNIKDKTRVELPPIPQGMVRYVHVGAEPENFFGEKGRGFDYSKHPVLGATALGAFTDNKQILSPNGGHSHGAQPDPKNPLFTHPERAKGDPRFRAVNAETLNGTPIGNRHATIFDIPLAEHKAHEGISSQLYDHVVPQNFIYGSYSGADKKWVKNHGYSPAGTTLSGGRPKPEPSSRFAGGKEPAIIPTPPPAGTPLSVW